jgi:hypothetical protein
MDTTRDAKPTGFIATTEDQICFLVSFQRYGKIDEPKFCSRVGNITTLEEIQASDLGGQQSFSGNPNWHPKHFWL